MKTHFPHFFRPISLLVAGLTWSFSALAAPVAPSAAAAEASDFLRQSHPGLKAAPSHPALTLAYTADADDLAAFYVFNYSDGFVIVSADDRLPAVLGYSDNGAFDETRIPENFKWWLGEYRKEIAGWLPTASEPTSTGRQMRAPIRREPIAPLTKTTWNQDAPYNNDCPLDQSGQRSVTGCVATAMAQLMKYHEWPKKPTGSSGGIVFDGTTYDWSHMLDHYERGNYTSSQAAAVAKLMRQCGAAVNMMYSSWASGAYDNAVPYAFIHYFNYNPELQLVWKDYTPQSKWNDMVYAEVAAGRPVYYSGHSSEGGHAFVCDGYSENEFFHFNWGWGGYQDGYFRLTALNPASGGAGSYEGGYNSGQTIITGLAPNTTGTTAPEQIALVSTGGFFYDKETTYVIKQDPSGYNMIYNPMIYSETVTVGLKFTNLDNPAAEPKYSSSGSVTLKSQYGFTELSASTPSLPDGTYSITPVFYKNNNDWQPILIPLGKQNYVRLTVTGGKASYENAGPDNSNKATLIVNMPITTPTIYGNADMAFRVPVLNVGDGDYMGNLGLTLVEKDDDFGDSISINDSAPISGNGYSEWDVSFTDHIEAGDYLLYVSDDDNNMLIDGVEVKVSDGNFPELADTGKLTVQELAPNFIVSGQENPIYFTINSTSIFEENMPFRFTVLDAKTLKKVKDLPFDYTLTIPAKFLGRVTVPPRDLGIEPGEYMWYVSNPDGEALSYATPLIVTSQMKTAGYLAYVVTNEKDKLARVVHPVEGAYTTGITVPASVSGYVINEISPDAFAFSTSSSVTLPNTVTEIPAGGFYNDYALRNLTLEATAIVEADEQAFNPKYATNCWLTVPNELTYDYRSSEPWKDFQMTNWALELDNVQIISGMELNPDTGLPYSPYYVNCFTPITIGLSAPESMNVEVLVVRNGEWLEYHTIDPKVTTVTLPAIGPRGWGKFQATATTNPVAVDTVNAETGPADVYSIDGRIVLRAAAPDQIRALAPGIYIIGGRKYTVK